MLAVIETPADSRWIVLFRASALTIFTEPAWRIWSHLEGKGSGISAEKNPDIRGKDPS